jgi:hypothetical protein
LQSGAMVRNQTETTVRAETEAQLDGAATVRARQGHLCPADVAETLARDQLCPTVGAVHVRTFTLKWS